MRALRRFPENCPTKSPHSEVISATVEPNVTRTSLDPSDALSLVFPRHDVTAMGRPLSYEEAAMQLRLAEATPPAGGAAFNEILIAAGIAGVVILFFAWVTFMERLDRPNFVGKLADWAG